MKRKGLWGLIIIAACVSLSGLTVSEGDSILQNRFEHFSLNPQMHYTVNTFMGPVVVCAYTDSNYATNPNHKRDGAIDIESADPAGDKSSCNMVGLFYHYMNPAAFSDMAVFSDSVDAVIQDSLIDMSSSINQCSVVYRQENNRVVFETKTPYDDICLKLHRKNENNVYELINTEFTRSISDNEPKEGLNYYKLNFISDNQIIKMMNIRIAFNVSDRLSGGLISIQEINRIMKTSGMPVCDITGKKQRKVDNGGVFFYQGKKFIIINR